MYLKAQVAARPAVLMTRSKSGIFQQEISIYLKCCTPPTHASEGGNLDVASGLGFQPTTAVRGKSPRNIFTKCSRSTDVVAMVMFDVAAVELQSRLAQPAGSWLVTAKTGFSLCWDAVS